MFNPEILLYRPYLVPYPGTRNRNSMPHVHAPLPIAPTDTVCDTFICSQFPCGRYLVWWVRVEMVNFGVRVSKLLGSNYNPNLRP